MGLTHPKSTLPEEVSKANKKRPQFALRLVTGQNPRVRPLGNSWGGRIRFRFLGRRLMSVARGDRHCWERGGSGLAGGTVDVNQPHNQCLVTDSPAAGVPRPPPAGPYVTKPSLAVAASRPLPVLTRPSWSR